MLTAASALTDVAEFTFDVDDHLYRSVGMGASGIGALMAATGVSSICSGGVAKSLIHRLGPAGYLLQPYNKPLYHINPISRDMPGTYGSYYYRQCTVLLRAQWHNCMTAGRC